MLKKTLGVVLVLGHCALPSGLSQVVIDTSNPDMKGRIIGVKSPDQMSQYKLV